MNQIIRIGKNVFDLEIANTPLARNKGLSNVSCLDLLKGMLFVFPDEQLRIFTMVGCLIPLDLVFVNRNGFVVRTCEMIIEPKVSRPPAQYLSDFQVSFAIEFAAWTIANSKIIPGLQIVAPWAELKAQAT